MKTSLKVFTIIILVIAAIFVLRKKPDSSLQKQTRFLMDTYCTIQAFGPKDITDKAITVAFNRMEEIDGKFNSLNPKSPLYTFNVNNTPIRDSEINNLIEIAQEISERSSGAFDITIQPLVELWGFYGNSPDLPERTAIEKCLQIIGYKNLLITENQIDNSSQDIRIDLGGIAKGYALREAAEALKGAGVDSALIDAGGDIYAIGKIKGENWKIGIRNPRGEGDIGVLEVSNLAVVASGDYERFFIKDDIKYCHILDPRTGYPARELASVTVVSPDPVRADAWATALFVLGLEGMKFVEEAEELEAIMITVDMKLFCSSGLLESLDTGRAINE